MPKKRTLLPTISPYFTDIWNEATLIPEFRAHLVYPIPDKSDREFLLAASLLGPVKANLNLICPEHAPYINPRLIE